jgi:Glycosyl hydrolases family 38 N-terminal domain
MFRESQSRQSRPQLEGLPSMPTSGTRSGVSSNQPHGSLALQDRTVRCNSPSSTFSNEDGVSDRAVSVVLKGKKAHIGRIGRGTKFLVWATAFLVLCVSASAGQTASGASEQSWTDKQVYVVPFSHLDLWYLGPPDDAYARFERILSGALDLAERDPRFRFTIEQGQFLHQYLLLRPEARPRIATALSNGQFDLSAQWSDLLYCPATAEDLVRNLLLAYQLAEKSFHYRPRAVVVGDVPGFTPQVVQLWHRAGIEGAMLTRGGPTKTPVFNWQAPDGSSVRIGYTVGGYATGWMAGLAFSLDCAEAKCDVTVYQSVRRKEVKFNSGLANLLAKTFPGPGPAILGAGPDLSFPSAQLTQVAEEWNRRHGKQIMVHVVTMPEFVNDTSHDNLPTLTGDWQSVWQTASLSVDRHATLARTSHQLQVAEKVATLASVLTPMRYPSGQLQQAWEWDLSALDHEGAALGDLPERVREVAGQIQARAAQAIASRIPTASKDDMVVAVINPLAWPRRVAVRVPLYLHGNIPSAGERWDQIVVRDEHGKILPAHLRVIPPHAVSKTGELFTLLDLPPLGYRSIVLEPEDKKPAASAEAAPWDTLTWKDSDPASDAVISQGTWEARYLAGLHSLALVHQGGMVAHVEIDSLGKPSDLKGLETPRPVGEGAITWTRVRRQESWNDSTLRMEGISNDAHVELQVELLPGLAPEVSSRVSWQGTIRHPIVQRITPAHWSLESVRYGVPFGELKFGSMIPGSGPSNSSDEIPRDLWPKMKVFDGWLSWQNGDAKVAMATEAHGAIFSDGGFSFVLAPSKGVFPNPCQEVSLRMRFQYDGAGSDLDAPARLTWELMEPPVTAVAEDRYGSMNLPSQFSLLHWNNPNLIVTGLRRDDLGRMIVRTYNHSAAAVRARMLTGLSTAGMEEVSPVESPIGKVTPDVPFSPWQIKTLRLRLKSETAGRPNSPHEANPPEE